MRLEDLIRYVERIDREPQKRYADGRVPAVNDLHTK
jgi:hypothetical protein